MIKRAALLAPGTTPRPEDLPERVRLAHRETTAAVAQSFKPLAALISGHIEQVLITTQWNISETARILDIPRSTLRGKMKTYGFAERSSDG